MELWSSGVYKATMHRVIFPAPSGTEREEKQGSGGSGGGGRERGDPLKSRYSLAFFVQPDDDVVSPNTSYQLCFRFSEAHNAP